ncbi:ABC transporter permease [Streptomyces sp. NPDC005648]|uniref:ABC transporter permease n=1 Tax=Streptomyces sp. NPDC005648 TaxID=3157044 RepID=UPI0033A9C742
MSALLDEKVTGVEAPSAGSPRRAVLALALFEGRRLLLRVPMLCALALYAVWIGWTTPDYQGGYPALQDADRSTQFGPLLVGLAALFCVNQAVLRSKRRDTERHFGVLPLEPWRRTAAHALSLVPVALLVAVGVGVQFGWSALKSGAVGSGSPAELLVGPLAVLLFGAFGVLVARLLPSGLTASLIVLFLFVLAVMAAPSGGGERGPHWLEPVVTDSAGNSLPADLLGRPAAWHALYLAAFALTVALAAMFAAGGRGRVLTGSLAGALALAVTGGVLQSGPLPQSVVAARERASVSPEKVQNCVRRDGSTYCAFPEWSGRVDTWAGVVRGVQSLAGGPAHDQDLVIRQRIDARYGLESDTTIEPAATAHQVTVGTAWGGNRVPEFSTAVASVLVAGSEKATVDLCDGRMVTIMWLGISGLPDPLQSLRHVRLDDSLTGSAIVLSPTNPLGMSAAQTDVVRELLGKNRDEVEARVKAHWTELTAPKVSTARAAALLGARAPRKGLEKCEA